MFVCPGQEEYIEVPGSFIPGQRVSGNGSVRMTDMRYVINIINRCGKVKGVFTQDDNPFRRSERKLLLFVAWALLPYR